MDYWLDLFTGTTWDEFSRAGATISGFRDRMRRTVARIQPGDVLLCYMTGVMRWVGALEVVGRSDDQREIWSVAEFPARLEVKPLIMLEAQYGVPMEELEGKVEFYEHRSDRGKFKGFIRRSPNLFRRPGDGELVFQLLRQAETSPVRRSVDPRKLARKPLLKAETKKGKKTVQTLVSIPEPDEDRGEMVTGEEEIAATGATQHTEIQYLLLRLGADMGLEVWVARNDRGRSFNGVALGNLPSMVEELPKQFNEATRRTIELIDVLWLKGNSIVAAFEVECTTAVYSGLLRMSDLLALQPNLNINLYIVAPAERKDKVEQEILRPTFMLRESPLAKVCGFISAAELRETIDAATKARLTSSLNPGFLAQHAEYFGEEE
ncbi:MAG: hypothetical protein MUP47_10505 [Phycisphaerae bacterium]|nr:hypothetical protein [Phycisphaerae bacterium]